MQKSLTADKTLQAYVIGLALGDGNLSNPNGRAVRLRISCDAKYPMLVLKISRSLAQLFPNNKVSAFRRKSNCIDISVYSNYLEELLGWSATGGSKYVQSVNIPQWIFESVEYQSACLRGLLETDGTIYNDRLYKTVMFTTVIKPLADSVALIFKNLGFYPRLYIIQQKTDPKSLPRYNIRLAKDVLRFLAVVNPEKL